MAHLNTLESKLSMVVEGVLLPVDMPLDIMGKAKRAITEQLLDVRYKNVDGMKKLLVKKEVGGASVVTLPDNAPRV